MFSGDFRRHPDLEGRHAFLSASKYAWLRYDDDKLRETYNKAMNAQLGTQLHDYAHMAIKLGRKQPNNGETLNMYINDCIGWRMRSEVVLAYSEHIFGTVDAIRFDTIPKLPDYVEWIDLGFKNLLRISDLKNGISPTKMDQLLIYACIFFLEYGVDPATTLVELRIYQNDDVELLVPSTVDLLEIMDHIEHCNGIILEEAAKA